MNIYPTLIALAALALVGAAAGIRLAAVPALARKIVPVSGGLLAGIALFWILPEIAVRAGWLASSAAMTFGFALLWFVDRYVHPVCPTCSHSHAHEQCHETLHGFATPLLLAAGIHSFFDGWSLAASQQQGLKTLQIAFLAGIAVHKLPEGLALGAILVAAVGSGTLAMLGATAAQAMMIAGGAAATILAPHLAAKWTLGLLAVAAGAFVYLGYHAFDSAYQQKRGAGSIMPALTGVIGAAALRGFLPGI